MFYVQSRLDNSFPFFLRVIMKLCKFVGGRTRVSFEKNAQRRDVAQPCRARVRHDRANPSSTLDLTLAHAIRRSMREEAGTLCDATRHATTPERSVAREGTYHARAFTRSFFFYDGSFYVTLRSRNAEGRYRDLRRYRGKKEISVDCCNRRP